MTTTRFTIRTTWDELGFEPDTISRLSYHDLVATDGHVSDDEKSWVVVWECDYRLKPVQIAEINEALNDDDTVIGYRHEFIDDLLDLGYLRAQSEQAAPPTRTSNWGGARPGAGRKRKQFSLRVGDAVHAIGGGVHAHEIYTVTEIGRNHVDLTSEAGWTITLVR